MFLLLFCIIPFAEVPQEAEHLMKLHAKALIELGVKELVLTGINLERMKKMEKLY